MIYPKPYSIYLKGTIRHSGEEGCIIRGGDMFTKIPSSESWTPGTIKLTWDLKRG